MKILLFPLFFFLSVFSVVSQQADFWLEISRNGEYHMKVTLHNPSNRHLALQVTHDFKTWGYLGSTTNSLEVFNHCYVALHTNAAFYRARTWTGPKIPFAPPCN